MNEEANAVLVLWAANGIARLIRSELAGSKPNFLDGLHRGIIDLVYGTSEAAYSASQ
jgi:hypothetical protein